MTLDIKENEEKVKWKRSKLQNEKNGKITKKDKANNNR